MSEPACGISCYANSSTGFTAILKHRYADFKVNEVDLQGEVVRLTSLEPPQVLTGPASSEGPSATDNSVPVDPADSVEGIVQRYAAISGAADGQLEPLRTFLHQALQQRATQQEGAAAVNAPDPLVLEPPLASKEQRTTVHQLFKSLPGFPRLVTSTVDPVSAQQGASPAEPTDQAPVKFQSIELAFFDGGGSRKGSDGHGRGQKRKFRDMDEWRGGKLRYTKFVMYKENMDSQQAIASLARMLRVSHKLFSVAGTKDKRGATVQQVTAFKLDPGRLAALNSRLRGVRVGNFSFAAEQLRLGDLQGNRFDIILRAISPGSREAVNAAVEALAQSGFINYYGLQRFGTGGIPTHRVGQTLLRGEWREAVRMLLTPREDCTRKDQVDASRLYLEHGDVDGALRRMPRFLVVEPLVLQGLKKNGPNGYLNAIMLIPRNLRTMYIHAYQSYLWNMAASHRIKTFGAHRVVDGDLVLPHNVAGRTAARNNNAQAADAAFVEAAADAPDMLANDDAEDSADADVQQGRRLLGEVHVVTAEEAAAGAWSIEDVVLPLPGSQVRYPENATAAVYQECAARDGVSLDTCGHNVADFSLAELPGAYRYLIQRPRDLEHEFIQYSHPDADLAVTELMALQRQQLPPPVAQDGAAGEAHLALRLAFTLPVACYATMLIRELTKQPTSVAHHTALTQRSNGTVGPEVTPSVEL